MSLKIAGCFLGMAVGLFSLARAESAGLKWEATRQVIEIATGKEKVSAEFLFTNTLPVPVKIQSVHTSCGCVTTEWSKKVYQPGESGAIRVVFVPDGRKGPQEKTIIVRMADREIPEAVLALRVEVPDSIKVDREKLTWKVGEPAAPRVFEVTAIDPEKTKIPAVKVLGTDFTAQLKQTEEGRYRVEVQPVSTERPVKGRVRMEIADPKSRAIYLKVAVEP